MSGFEHIELNIKWDDLLKKISSNFGEIEEIKDVIFLIGVQELGSGFRNFTKEEKLDVMHLAICHILCDYGYYEYAGKDKEGWPHYKALKSLPSLTEQEKEFLFKEAILEYFEKK